LHVPGPVAELEPYHREGRWYFRRRHNTVRSPRLRAFDACVGALTRGRHHRGLGPLGDELDVWEALREASRECSRRLRGVL
jgi:hypothetical protein